jgi:hypothetical protein
VVVLESVQVPLDTVLLASKLSEPAKARPIVSELGVLFASPKCSSVPKAHQSPCSAGSPESLAMPA